MKRYAFTLSILLCGLSSAQSATELDCLRQHTGSIEGLYNGNRKSIVFGNELQTNWQGWDVAATQTARLAAALKAKGIKLIVAPIPTRLMVDPLLLDEKDARQSEYLRQEPQKKFSALIGRYRSLGVTTVDLLPPLKTGSSSYSSAPVFLANDFHWTQAGAVIGAVEIAKTIRTISPSLPKEPYALISTSVAKANPIDPIKKLQAICGQEQWLTFPAFASTKLDTLFFIDMNEQESGVNSSWRWATGSKADLAYVASKPSSKKLLIEFNNQIPGQSIALSLNGKYVYKLQKVPLGISKAEIDLNFVPGRNNLRFSFGSWNHKTPSTTFAPKDARQLALSFLQLGFPDDDQEQPTGDQLLNDQVPAVTLVGTSYSEYMLLAELLKGSLQTDILDASQSGKGFLQPMMDYLTQLEGSGKPQIIVWEIPMMWTPNGAEAEIAKMIQSVNKLP